MLQTNNDCVLGLGRYYEGEKLLALFNFSENDQTAWINEGETYTDLISGETMDAKAVALGPHSFRWLYLNYNDPKFSGEKEEA